MDEINNSTFSDVPSLGDTEGLNAYLEREQLSAQGIQPETQTKETTGTTNPGAVTPESQPAPQPAPVNGLTSEQVAALMSRIDAIDKRLNTQPVQPVQPQPRPQVNAGGATYTPQERAFVNEALTRGYSLEQINATILKHRGGGQDAMMAQRMSNLENYIKQQAYRQAESAFIDRISTFGEKFGLSEQDLVTFGNAALQKGINIAMPNVDLETVFRAVYPEQYRIRTQRMTPTNASQIYGGTSIPESSRVAASRMEDAYVDAFLKQSMPNYGKK